MSPAALRAAAHLSCKAKYPRSGLSRVVQGVQARRTKMGRVRLAALSALACALACALAFSGNASGAVPNGPSPDLVISQIYGGGGNTGATYRQDFIEIFNRGTSSVPLAGRSLQYASATGTGFFGANSTQLTELP